ncbi:hypothetical protein RhiirC2_801463, partial [Rhizophagus irregularis]
DGHSTDLAVNNPNANNGGTIVASGICIRQVLHHFRYYFTTITSEKSKLTFHAIVQGSDTVSRFYSKLRKMIRLAYPTLLEANQNELVRQQFLNEIEKYKTDIIPASISTLTPVITYQDLTLANIKNLINSKIPVTTAFSSPQNDTSF